MTGCSVAPLAAAGVSAEARVWDDREVRWAEYDLAVLRSTWDYPARRDEFVAWARRVRRLANPPDVVVWNTDKRYLAELAARGVPVVPTKWIWPGDDWTPPHDGEWVIKPAIGAGSKDTGRYDAADPEHRWLAGEHVTRLQAAGRMVMVQPYLGAVDRDGETALMFLRRHVLARGPKGADADRPGRRHGRPLQAGADHPVQADPAELTVAGTALAAAPGGRGRLLYARVDTIPGRGGEPLRHGGRRNWPSRPCSSARLRARCSDSRTRLSAAYRGLETKANGSLPLWYPQKGETPESGLRDVPDVMHRYVEDRRRDARNHQLFRRS